MRINYGVWGRPANSRERKALQRGDTALANYHHANHWLRSIKRIELDARNLKEMYFPNGRVVA